MKTIIEKIYNSGIVPVISFEDAKDSVPVCKTLSESGIKIAEITLRTAAAEQSIKNVSENLPDVLVGAGTVLTVDLAKKAISAGAKFLVTPGFNVPVVEYCIENNICIIPGVSSPTDIELGLKYNLTNLKFFPAEASGGLKALKAMSAPYGMVRFMPTGGIDLTNIGEYMKFDKIIACGGTYLVTNELVKAGKFSEISRLADESIKAVHGFDFFHMGINTEENLEADGIADKFAKVFGFSKRETDNSYFSSEFIEIMKNKGLGKNGHIGIKTNNVKRARPYLESLGIELDMSTMRGTPEKPTFIYLKEQIGGFAVHIVQ